MNKKTLISSHLKQLATEFHKKGFHAEYSTFSYALTVYKDFDKYTIFEKEAAQEIIKHAVDYYQESNLELHTVIEALTWYQMGEQ